MTDLIMFIVTNFMFISQISCFLSQTDNLLNSQKYKNIYLHAEGTLQEIHRNHYTCHKCLWSYSTPNVPLSSYSTEALVKRLKKINTSRAVALAVMVNSPGGLPVQSQIVSDKLKEYSAKHNLKMYTFARDLAASGGYMVLCGGDHVVADKTSIVGSIGVVFQKAKLTGLMERFDLDYKRLATQEYFLT